VECSSCLQVTQITKVMLFQLIWVFHTLFQYVLFDRMVFKWLGIMSEPRSVVRQKMLLLMLLLLLNVVVKCYC